MNVGRYLRDEGRHVGTARYTPRADMELNADKLAAIATDPDASRNERDAAKEARQRLQAGLSVPRELVGLLQTYHGRMLGQNRWGK